MKNVRKDKAGLTLPLFKNTDPVPVIQPNVSSITPQIEEHNILLLPASESKGVTNQLKNGVDYINVGEEDQSEVYGYRRSLLQTGLTWTMILLTGGFLRLIFHWAPQWMLKATHVKCSLGEATRVLVVESYKKYRKCFVKDIKVLSADRVRYDQEYSALRSGVSVCKSSVTAETGVVNLQDRNCKEDFPKTEYLVIPNAYGQMKCVKSVRWFRCKKLCYIWDPDTESFYRLSGLDSGQTLSDLHTFQGFSWFEQLRRRVVYGENGIRVPVTPILKLLFLEALNPFYIFQVFSVCLWFADDYIYYASVIVISSVLSIISEVYQMHRNQVTLRSTIQSSGTIEVLRENGQSETIPSEHLVPGDVVVVPPQGCMMQCDAVLLQGTAIVNESMLTGESVPVTKTPVLNRKDILFKEKEFPIKKFEKGR